MGNNQLKIIKNEEEVKEVTPKQPVDGILLLIAIWVFLSPINLLYNSRDVISAEYTDNIQYYSTMFILTIRLLWSLGLAYAFWTEKRIVKPMLITECLLCFLGCVIGLSVFDKIPAEILNQTIIRFGFELSLYLFIFIYMLRSTQVKQRFTEPLWK